MPNARFPFVTDEAPKSPFAVTDHLGAQTVYVCPHCKTGGLRIAHEIQYEGGCFTSEYDRHHFIDLCLVDGTLRSEPIIPDRNLLEMLRIPLYCKQCGEVCALVFRADGGGHFYSSLEVA